MGRGIAKVERSRLTAATGPIQVTVSLNREESDRLRDFAKANEFENVRTAIRALIQAALSDYPRWAIVHAERKSALYEFKAAMHERTADFLTKLKQELEDEHALMEITRAYPT